MTRRQIEKIFKEHEVCNWYEKFEFTDCKVNIITELVKLSNKKPKMRYVAGWKVKNK